MADPVKIKVTPETSLADEPCQITFNNLAPLQTVTTFAIILNDEDDVVYYSSAEFVSDANGKLSVGESFSYKGTYLGIEPMGLFWSAVSAPGQRKGMRLVKRKFDESSDWLIFLIDGSIDENFVAEMVDLVRNGNSDEKTPFQVGDHLILASGVAKRYFCYISDIDFVNLDGNIKGTVFFPRGLKRRSLNGENFASEKEENANSVTKGILNMMSGGVETYKTALLAQRGFVVLNMAYHFDSLKKETSTSLSYLKEAVDFMLSDKFPVHFDSKSGIGILGLCKGATMALEVASFYPIGAIKAVITLNPSCHHRLGIYTREDGGEDISRKFTANDPEVKRCEGGLIFKGVADWFFNKSLEDREKFCIPVEKIRAQLLLVFGEDDESSSIRNLHYMLYRLKEARRSNYKCLVYPGTGHLINPPIIPLCHSYYWSYFKDTVMSGGQAKLHHNAELDVWKHTMAFFKMHLHE